MLDKLLADKAIQTLRLRKDFSSLWNSLTDETQNKIFDELVSEYKAIRLEEAYEKYAKV